MLVKPLHCRLAKIAPGRAVTETHLGKMVPDPLVPRVPDALSPLDSAKVGQDVEPDDHDGIGPEFPASSATAAIRPGGIPQ